MIYTVGQTDIYEEVWSRGVNPGKKGKSEDCIGGSVWKTREEAQAYLDKHPNLEYSIYGVDADWDKDTEPSEREWHNLLIDSPLVRLD
jgi:hypothetical protein